VSTQAPQLRTRGRPSVFNLVKIDESAVHIQHYRWSRSAAGFSPRTRTRSPARAPRCHLGAGDQGCDVNDLLAHRLELLGLRDVDPSTPTPTHRDGEPHRPPRAPAPPGYASAPDRVLRAIVRSSIPVCRARSAAARAEFLAFRRGACPAAAQTDAAGPSRPGTWRCCSARVPARALQRRVLRGPWANPDPSPAAADPPGRAGRGPADRPGQRDRISRRHVSASVASRAYHAHEMVHQCRRKPVSR